MSQVKNFYIINQDYTHHISTPPDHILGVWHLWDFSTSDSIPQILKDICPTTTCEMIDIIKAEQEQIFGNNPPPPFPRDLPQPLPPVTEEESTDSAAQETENVEEIDQEE